MKFFLKDMHGMGLVTVNVPGANGIVEVNALSESMVVEIAPVTGLRQAFSPDNPVMNVDYFEDGAKFYVPHHAFVKLEESRFNAIVRECVAKFGRQEAVTV